MNVPAVSVILPAYNCEKYIAKAIVSLLHQTFTDFEFIFINDKEEKTGSWELDRKTITSKQIKDQLLFENCIAHPSVMMRTAILKELKYNEKQENIEDYDLWLRVLNRGISIAKINEPLLLYRS